MFEIIDKIIRRFRSFLILQGYRRMSIEEIYLNIILGVIDIEFASLVLANQIYTKDDLVGFIEFHSKVRTFLDDPAKVEDLSDLTLKVLKRCLLTNKDKTYEILSEIDNLILFLDEKIEKQ